MIQSRGYWRVWLCLCDKHRVGVLTAMFKSYEPLIQDTLPCSILFFFFNHSAATVPFYCSRFKSLNWPHILGQYLGTLLWSIRFKLRPCDPAKKLENLSRYETWICHAPLTTWNFTPELTMLECSRFLVMFWVTGKNEPSFGLSIFTPAIISPA